MRTLRRDDGLGLTEVMISMLLLAIIMMAILSLLIITFRSVAENSTRAAANELATERLELVRSRAATGDCAVVSTTATATDSTEDARGVPLEVTGTIANCVQVGDPHGDPVLATVTVSVTTTDPNLDNPVAVTTSDVYVKFDPGA